MPTSTDLGANNRGGNVDPVNPPLSALSPHAQANFKAESQKLVDIMFTRTMDVGFELIKHFVAVNAAGVAGATALASAVADAAKLAIPYFFGGMVVAIITMIVVYVNGMLITSGLSKRLSAVVNTRAPITTFKFSRSMWAGIVITWILSFISIVLFVLGASVLVVKTYPSLS